MLRVLEPNKRSASMVEEVEAPQKKKTRKRTKKVEG
nr:MAG TPA: hypothetical protein [Caudoviricetes sp.]